MVQAHLSETLTEKTPSRLLSDPSVHLPKFKYFKEEYWGKTAPLYFSLKLLTLYFSAPEYFLHHGRTYSSKTQNVFY